MKRFRIMAIAVALMAAVVAEAQNIKECWITGTAVPGGVQKLESRPDGSFMYAGKLVAG